ncbi:MAG TPA: hypothetical protein VFR05_02875 [Terriglobia bacterium]|nr:hypothetical protein [Terriglobia bacterium]
MRRSPEQTRPEFRQLRIYAIDPMVSRAGEHQATVQIRFEDLELRGGDDHHKVDPVSFVGKRVEIVDVDAAGEDPVWLKPVNLDDANIAMQHGLDPSESDPQFHQQMVYAVTMRTLEQFDRALGRVVQFSGRRRLRLVPHAFRGSNAFYHPNLRAVLFGYFRASRDAPGDNLPGQVIFTCLSHDIIAHEVTHALVDRLRPYFNVATNPHVRAFHEGFADIVAVFQRLSFRDLVQRALQDVRGDLRKSNLLADIAAQFGQGLGSGKALRSALGKSDTKIQDVHEEHDLGAVLVAAIFEGFYKTFERRTADLIRLATGGTGELPSGAIHPDLVARLTTECVKTAQLVLTICIRAFDYLPPTDVTFGAFLRALVTADWELNPLDEIGIRASLIEACRQRGIFAVEAGSLAVSALLLDVTHGEEWEKHEKIFQEWVDHAIRRDIEEQRAGAPDDAGEPSVPANTGFKSFWQQAPFVRSEAYDPEELLEAGNRLRLEISKWFNALPPEERGRLGFLPGAALKPPHFHSSRRVTSDGTLRFGLVVQLVQMQTIHLNGIDREFPWGATLVIDVTGRVRFFIGAPPLAQRVPEMTQMAQSATTSPLGWALDDAAADPFAVDYRGMHEVRT